MNSVVPHNTFAAITVTYEPDLTWAERLAAITEICPHCVVVDNSISTEGRTHVREVTARHVGVELISNHDNPGIGKALNQGCRALLAAGHQWGIAFDQDSKPCPGFIDALKATLSRTSAQKIGIVGANWRDVTHPEKPSRFLAPGSVFGVDFRRLTASHDLTDIFCVITSGSLFSLDAWRDLGGFDEDLFLDLVDTDYCLRARQAGWAIAVSSNARIDHRRGAKRPVHLFGRAYFPSFMPPFRLHNLARNRLLLFSRHGRQAPAWVCYELAYAAKLLTDILLFEDNKREKLLAFARGTWEGLTHRRKQPRRL